VVVLPAKQARRGAPRPPPTPRATRPPPELPAHPSCGRPPALVASGPHAGPLAINRPRARDKAGALERAVSAHCQFTAALRAPARTGASVPPGAGRGQRWRPRGQRWRRRRQRWRRARAAVAPARAWGTFDVCGPAAPPRPGRPPPAPQPASAQEGPGGLDRLAHHWADVEIGLAEPAGCDSVRQHEQESRDGVGIGAQLYDAGFALRPEGACEM
jgi:hypothetical protein